MAQLAVLIAGLLLFAMSQASDVEEADPSTFQGFLSKEMPDLKKLMVPTFSDANHGNRPDALSHNHNLAEHSPEADGGASPFMIIDDKPILHPAPQVQDLSALTSARGKSAIATKEEEKAAQKLFANGKNTPITLSAIIAGILAFVTMLGVYIWRGLRPAMVLASSGTLGSDEFNKMVPSLCVNIMEMKSQNSSINAAAFGEGISDSRGSEAHADHVPSDLEWDPLDLLPSDPTAGWQPAVFSLEGTKPIEGGGSVLPRRASLAAGLLLAAMPCASHAVGVRDGLLERCPETPSCISSQDDAARGGRSFRPPWAYDDLEWTGARDKLLLALRTGADGEVVVDGRYIRCGDLEFFFTENDATVQFRGDGRDVDKRLAKLRQRCGFEEIVVLRNRRRAFGVGESALDSFGPSFFDTGDAALLAPDALKTKDPDPMAPESFPAPDKATRKWLREKRAEAM